MRSTLLPLLLVLLTGACTALEEGGGDPHVQPVSPGPTPNAPIAPVPPGPTPSAPIDPVTPAPTPGAPAAPPAEGPTPPDARLEPVAPAADAGATDLAPDTASAPDAASPCPTATAGTYGQPCGACGGTISCSGACTVPTPADHGQVKVSAVEVLERTGSESTRQGEWIGRDCADGHVGGGCSVTATHSGVGGPELAGCQVTREGRTCRCRVRWWADPGVTLRCTVTILTRRVCDR